MIRQMYKIAFDGCVPLSFGNRLSGNIQCRRAAIQTENGDDGPDRRHGSQNLTQSLRPT